MEYDFTLNQNDLYVTTLSILCSCRHKPSFQQQFVNIVGKLEISPFPTVLSSLLENLMTLIVVCKLSHEPACIAQWLECST